MNIVNFNFKKIYTYNSFYNRCKKKLNLPGYFGNNLDALWDILTSEIELPITINCLNVTSYHEKKFDELFKLLNEAANELGGQLQINILTADDESSG